MRLKHKKQQGLVKSVLGVLVILGVLAAVTAYMARPSLAAWWPSQSGGTNWGQRRQLTVTNNSGSTIDSGTAVAVSIDTQSLYQTGKVRSDCADLRIVYQSGASTFKELTRAIVTPGNVACSQSGATRVYFQLEAQLTDNSSSSYYYAYYANPRATAPTGTDAVFSVGSKTATLVCPFDGTTTCLAGETPTTATGAIRYSGSKSALELDGQNDFVSFADSSFARMTKNFTYEAWVRVNRLNHSFQEIMGIGWDSWADMYVEPNGALQASIRYTNWDSSYLNPEVWPEMNTWHHLAISVDDRTVRFFVDGILNQYAHDSIGSRTIGAAASDFFIGNSNGGNTNAAITIDEARVSNITRYVSNFTPQTTPFVRDAHTVLLLHFDENGSDPRNANKVIDDSGNGYHGTINGAVKYTSGLVGSDNSVTDTGHDNSQSYAGHEGIFMEEGTTNKITNPSFENSTYSTNWNVNSYGSVYANTISSFLKSGVHSARLDNTVTSYPENNSRSVAELYTSNEEKRLAQGFQVPQPTSPVGASLYMYYRTASGYYFNVEIQPDSSGHPSGMPVANGSSNCVAFTTLNSYTYQNINLTFSTPPSLSSGTQYYLVLKAYTNSGCTTESSSQIPDSVAWTYDASGSYPYGTEQRMDTSNVWTTDTAEDFIFTLIKQSTNDYTLTTAVNAGNTNTHTLSAYVYNGTYPAAGGTVDATIASLIFNGSTVSTIYTDTGGGWWRLTYSAAGINGSADYGVAAKVGKTIYIDSVQLEENTYATTYTDGSLGTGYSWSGTPDSGPGIRSDTRLSYDSAGNFATSAFTISTWVKLTSGNTDGDRTFLASDNSLPGVFLAIRYLSQCSNNFGFQISDNQDHAAADCTTARTLNRWYHLVGTWNGSVLTMYVDGTAGGVTSNTFSATANSHITVGWDSNSNGGPANSVMSDLRIYNSALSSAEVIDLYNAGLVAHSEGLAVDRFSDSKGQNPVAIWHFDEGTGTVAHDSSTYGNNLTLFGSARWDASSSGNLRTSLGRNLAFSGSDGSATRSADTDFDFGTSPFTIGGWFRHPSIISGIQTILSRYDGTAGYKVYMDSSAHICFGIDDDSAWGPDDSVCSAAAYTDSTWHNFTAVRDTGLAMYVDGIRVAFTTSITATGSLNSSSSLVIGSDTGNTDFWQGNLDEIVIYPYARTVAQILTDISGPQTAITQGSQSSDPLTNGLVGYWKLDEASGNAVDSSGNGNTLTNYNTSAYAGGKFGNAASFTAGSDQSLSIDDNPLLSTGNIDYSVAFWIYPADSDAFHGVLAKAVGADSQKEFIFRRGWTNEITFSWFTDNTGWGNAKEVATAPLSANTWHLVVAYHDAKNNKIGISADGSKFETATAAGGNDDTAPFNLGAETQEGTNEFTGRLDEVRVYKRVLTPADVSQLYAWAPGPVLYWNLDEGQGNVVHDSSGNSFDTTNWSGNPAWTNGKYGKAMQFNNDTDAFSYNNIVLTSATATINLWVYLNSYPSGNAGIGAEGSSQWSIKVDSSGYIDGCYGSCGSEDLWTNSSTVTPLKTWTFVTLISDGTNVRILVNGNQTGTATTGTINPMAAGLGAYGYGGWPAVRAIIDNFQIYNYVRTPKQLTEDMNAGHPAPGSPVGSALGHWRFDEGSGTIANNSGNGGSSLNGTISGASWSNSGKLGKALSFNGTSNYVDLPFNEQSPEVMSAGLTVSAWIKTGQSSGQVIMQTSQTGCGLECMGGIRLQSGKTRMTIYNGTDYINADSSTNVNDNNWHYLTGIYDTKGSINIYIDGQLENSKYSGSAYSEPVIRSYVGAFNENGTDFSNFFTGLIDEVKMYNFALSSDQVKTEYNLGKSQVFGSASAIGNYCVPGDTSPCNPPVGEWLLDEKNGATTADTSGNNRTGTLSGGPQWTNGKLGNALQFNSAKYVQVSDNDDYSITTTGKLSVESWVKPSSNDGYIASKRWWNGSANYEWDMQINSSGQPRVEISDLAGNPYMTSTGTTVLPQNQWSHIGFTVDTAVPRIRLFVNGVIVDENTTTYGATPANGTAPLQINGEADGVNYLSNITIDNVLIYNYARTPTQIAWDYSRGAPVIQYNFDECQGTVLHNSAPLPDSRTASTPSGTLAIVDGGSTLKTPGICSSGIASESWNTGTAGKYSSALALDGTNDFVSLGYVPDTTNWTGLTVSTWFKSNQSGGSRQLISKWDEGNLGQGNSVFELWLDGSGHTYFFISTDSGGGEGISSLSTITDTGWHQAIGTWNGSVFILYVDGLPVAQKTKAGKLYNSAPLFIGRSAVSPGRYWDGLIDDVRIYNYGLTPTQVRTLYNASSSVSF